MALDTNLEQIESLYVGYFGRAGEPDGVTYWLGRLENGMSLSEIAASFSVQPETTNQYPYLAHPDLVNPSDFVEQVYQNLFHRAADADGLAYWTGQLLARHGDPAAVGQFILDVISGAYGPGGSADDRTTIENKVEAASYYTQDLADAGIGGTHIEDGHAVLDANVSTSAHAAVTNVTSDHATVDASEAASDAFVSGNGNPGQTFTLTNSTDVVNGTIANDTIIAGTQAGFSTLNAGDSINGGGGTDTLKIFGDANVAAFTTATIKSVEQIYAQMNGTLAAPGLDVHSNADVTQAWVASGSTGSNTVTLTTAQTGGVQGAQTAGSTQTFNFQNVGGTADAATIALDGANLDAGTISVAGIEMLTLNATGTNTIGTLLDTDLKTLDITGDGSVSLTTATGASFKTIDAHAATGNLTLDIHNAAANDMTITTGSGNDAVTTLFANLSNADHIDLGVGIDSLIFSDAATVTTSAQAAAFANVTGVDVLGSTNGASLNVDNSVLTGYHEFSAHSSFLTITNAADGTTLDLTGVSTSTVSLVTGAHDLNVNLTATVADGPATAAVAVTGATVVDVATSEGTGASSATANILSLTVGDNATINVSGSHALQLFVTDNGLLAPLSGETINASAATGALEIHGDALQHNVITGGTSNDVIFGSNINDQFTGGTGGDSFHILTNGAAIADATSADVVTDFTSGADHLVFDAGLVAGTATNFAANTAVVADYTAALTAANTAFTGNASLVYDAQQVGSNTFLFQDSNGDHVADQVVQLAGVDLQHIHATDITVA